MIICSIRLALYIPQLSRIVRANVMAAYGEDYVRAVIVSGARAPWILDQATSCVTRPPRSSCSRPSSSPTRSSVEASLTFIGSGLQATTVATWGNVLSEASSNLSVLLGKWWTAFFPGLFIMITVLCLNILSEGITDAMVAAPASAAVAQVDKDSDREADKLLLDPRRAYAEQAASLQARLDDLETVEEQRFDRFEADFEKTPLLEVKDLCIKFDRHGDVNVVDHVSFNGPPRRDHGPRGRVPAAVSRSRP